MSAYFIEPLDVLVLRDNKLFGDPGSFGQSSLPPWPSVMAGALRSWLLVHDKVDLQQFSDGKPHPILGKPAEPGSFMLTDLQLARRQDDACETLRLPPADLIVTKADGVSTNRLQPQALAAGIQASTPLALLPVLAQRDRTKPESGYWLDEAGWVRYLSGKTVEPQQLVRADALFSTELRVGIGMDADKRSAADGALFSTQAIALKHGVGFIARVAGAELPAAGMLRLGGEGRGARVERVQLPDDPDLVSEIGAARRCRIVLTTPGVFAAGWRLPGMEEDGRFALNGVRGRVVAACVQRGEVISGFDLARRKPKDAQRMAPAGSVYWIDELEADAEALGKLAAHGLWPAEGYDASRRAEGFNRFALGLWSTGS